MASCEWVVDLVLSSPFSMLPAARSMERGCSPPLLARIVLDKQHRRSITTAAGRRVMSRPLVQLGDPASLSTPLTDRFCLPPPMLIGIIWKKV